MSEEKDWGKTADNFDEITEYVIGKDIVNEMIKKLAEEKNLGSVIEFGCGTGYFTRIIAKNAKQVIATDVSNDMLKVVKKQLREYENINFQKADCKSTSFPDNEFDTVLMGNLLHVIKNPHEAMEESWRILKKGGSFISIDLTAYGMKKFDVLKLAFRYLRKIGKPPKGAKNNLTPKIVESLAEKAGFRIEENILLGNKIKALYFKGVKK